MINLTDKHIKALTWIVTEADKYKDPGWGYDDHMTADAVERMFRDARSGLVALQSMRALGNGQPEAVPSFRTSIQATKDN